GAARRRRPARRRTDPARPAGNPQARGNDRAQPVPGRRCGGGRLRMPATKGNRAPGALPPGVAAFLRAVLLAGLVGGGAQAQDGGDAQRKLDRAQRELREVAAERRKIENARGAASRDLRAMDETLAKAGRALHDTETDLVEQRKALAAARERQRE